MVPDAERSREAVGLVRSGSADAALVKASGRQLSLNSPRVVSEDKLGAVQQGAREQLRDVWPSALQPPTAAARGLTVSGMIRNKT